MIWIFALAALLCVAAAVIGYIKDKLTPDLPAEYWANTELKKEDIVNGASLDQIIKYAKEGRYKIDEE